MVKCLGFGAEAGPKAFLAASRGFGDLLLKGPYPVLRAGPEVQAHGAQDHAKTCENPGKPGVFQCFSMNFLCFSIILRDLM